MKKISILVILFLPLISYGQFEWLFGGGIKVNLRYSNKFIADSKDTIFILENDIVNFKKNIDVSHDLMPANSYFFNIPKDLKDGHYRCYYDTLYQIKALNFSIKNKKIDGIFEEYYAHGILRFTSFYIDGLKNGLDIKYHTTGKISSVYQYQDNKRLGFHLSFFDNSTIAEIAYFKNDSTSTTIESWGQVSGKPSLNVKNKIIIKK